MAPPAGRPEPPRPVRRPMGIAIIAVLIGVGAIGILVVLVARNGSEDPRPAATGDELTPAAAVEAIVGLTPEAADRRVGELVDGAPEEQRAALADGDVTLAEYETAVRSTVSCFEAGFAELAATPSGPSATLSMDPVVVSPDSFEITYSYAITTVPGAATRIDQTAVADLEERCHRDHQQSTKDVYQTRRLADPGYLSPMVTAFMACAADAGVPSFGTTPEQMMTTLQGFTPETRNALRPCFDDAPSVAVGLGSKVRP